MSHISLNVQTRSTGKRAAKDVRQAGMIPGVIYSKSQEPIAVTVNPLDMRPVVYTSKAHLLSVTVDNKQSIECILKDISFHPMTDQILHFDLFGITADEPIIAKVPVKLVGNSKGAMLGGIVQQITKKLVIKCLPKHLPTQVEVDITNLEIGSSLRLREVSWENLTMISTPDVILVSILAPRVRAAK